MADYEFTFILPSLNEGRRLMDTVESILETSADAAVQIVVVDDCSDDYSGYDVAMNRDPRVIVVSGLGRLGVAGARQLGALVATGETLFFLDAHSQMPKDWTDEIRDAISLCGRKCVYGTSLYPLNSTDESAIAYGVWYDTPDVVEHYSTPRLHTDRPYQVMGLPGGSIVVDREFFWELGGFDMGLAPPWGQENMELCMRAWLMGFEVRMIPSCTVKTLYKDGPEANPGIKAKNLIYNRLRIALLYFSRDRLEKAVNTMRHEDWFAEALAILVFDRWDLYQRRAVQHQIDSDSLFERFGLDW